MSTIIIQVLFPNIRIGVTLVSLMIFLRFWGVHADEPVDWRSISDGTHLYAAADERKRPFG